MKTIILSLAIALSSYCTYAQYLPLTAGPGYPLSGLLLTSVYNNNQIALNNNVIDYGFISNPSTETWALGYGPSVNTLGTSVLTWNASGSVGIRTTSPGAKLHIQADANTSGAPDNAQFYITGNAASGKRLSLVYNTSSNYSEIQSQVYIENYTALNLNPNGGNVLIGKTSQRNIGYIPDVNGSARANEIVVNTTGADFVFDKKYLLRKLSDVKDYIDEHHHLPEIPSANEMKTNGMELGEMNKKLLQKVEELTLYLIEKDKQLTKQNVKLTELQKQNGIQKNKSAEQEARIDALENRLSKLTENQSK
ncbi:MAG TPA: hypothetical protein VNW51_04725 [Mucilaginibacter sp.]|jgi:hypothetical protein|nr:hypothetical protein [Mucilaginibacter sp.]